MSDQRPNFMVQHLMNLGGLANWPNTNVVRTALVTELIPEICQVPYDYLFRDDPKALTECTLLVWEYLDLDILTANIDVYDFEAEAMGAELRFYPDHCPDFNRNEYFIKGREDFHKLKYTGLGAGRFPFLLEVNKYQLQYVQFPAFPVLSAPWTLAGNLYGLDNLVIDCIEDPEFVHDFLNTLVDDYMIPLWNDLIDAFPGMDTMQLVDAYVTVPMVTVDIVEEFVRPALERLMAGTGNRIALLDTAFFGQAKLNEEDRKRFEEFVMWSNGRFFCSDPDVAVLTPEYARRRADEVLLPLQTGVDAKVIEFGTKEEIVNRIKHYTLAGKNGITPCIFFFNNFTPRTSEENLQIAVQALRIYGAPGADENTPYVDPEFISFKDFVKNKMADNVEGYSFEWVEKSGLKDYLTK